MNDQDRFEQAVAQRKRTEQDVLLSKHRDYGPKNIANAPGGPVMGLAVRLHDKLARLAHLAEQDVGPEHESLADTALDIANYGTILALVLQGDWPGVDGPTEEPSKPTTLGDLGEEVPGSRFVMDEIDPVEAGAIAIHNLGLVGHKVIDFEGDTGILRDARRGTHGYPEYLVDYFEGPTMWHDNAVTRFALA